jgi:hypothetical protein
MILAIVQIADPVADMHGPFNPPRNDLVVNFFFQNVLAKVRQKLGAVADDRPIPDGRAVADDGPITRIRSVADAGPIDARQLVGKGTFAAQSTWTVIRVDLRYIVRARRWSVVQEVIEATSRHRLGRSHVAGQVDRWNRGRTRHIDVRQTCRNRTVSDSWAVTKNRTILAGQRASVRLTDDWTATVTQKRTIVGGQSTGTGPTAAKDRAVDGRFRPQQRSPAAD